MTQADAAQVIDAARTTIIAIEKGERRLKPNELIKLARAYGKAVSDSASCLNTGSVKGARYLKIS
jgi:DNA-binding XRE family transcriptional regulator